VYKMHSTYITLNSDLINSFKINMFSVQVIFNKIQGKASDDCAE